MVFFSPLSVGIKGVQVNSGDQVLLDVATVNAKAQMVPLLSGNLIIDKLHVTVKEVLLSDEVIKKLSQKKDQASTGKSQKSFLRRSSIDNLSVDIKDVSYEDVRLQGIKAQSNTLEINDLSALPGSLFTDLDIEIDELIHPFVHLTKCASKVSLKQSVLETKKFQCLAYDKEMTLALSAKVAPDIHDVKAKLLLSSLDLDLVSKFMGEKLPYPVVGSIGVHVDAHIESLGNLASITSEVKVSGKDLLIQNIDADQLIEAYMDSNKASLLDVAGFMTLGPIGVLASQSAKMSQSLPGVMGGKTNIPFLHLLLHIENGLVSFDDVAFSTSSNRLAAKGSITIVEREFEDFKVGFLNKKGCADLVQKIKGPVSKPEFGVGKSVLKTIAAPVTDVTKKLGNLVTGGCKVFYEGVVAHP